MFFKEHASTVSNCSFTICVLIGECFKIKDIQRYLFLNNYAAVLMTILNLWVRNSTVQEPVL